MNKIIISLISSLFLFFAIWCIVLFAKYGNDWTNYRIDLVSAFSNLNIDTNYNDIYIRFNNVFDDFQQNIIDYETY